MFGLFILVMFMLVLLLMVLRQIVDGVNDSHKANLCVLNPKGIYKGHHFVADLGIAVYNRFKIFIHCEHCLHGKTYTYSRYDFLSLSKRVGFNKKELLEIQTLFDAQPFEDKYMYDNHCEIFPDFQCVNQEILLSYKETGKAPYKYSGQKLSEMITSKINDKKNRGTKW